MWKGKYRSTDDTKNGKRKGKLLVKNEEISGRKAHTNKNIFVCLCMPFPWRSLHFSVRVSLSSHVLRYTQTFITQRDVSISRRPLSIKKSHSETCQVGYTTLATGIPFYSCLRDILTSVISFSMLFYKNK